MTRTDAAWLAGIIDGEGYVDAKRRRVTVTNCDMKLLDEVKRVAGCGAIHTTGPCRSEKHRPAYRWSVAARADVATVLRSVFPRLITKRDVARNVILETTCKTTV